MTKLITSKDYMKLVGTTLQWIPTYSAVPLDNILVDVYECSEGHRQIVENRYCEQCQKIRNELREESIKDEQ